MSFRTYVDLLWMPTDVGQIIGYKTLTGKYLCFFHWLDLANPLAYPIRVGESQEAFVKCPKCED